MKSLLVFQLALGTLVMHHLAWPVDAQQKRGLRASSRRELLPGDNTLDEIGNNGEPAMYFPLERCKGDCDNDSECKGNLVCFLRGGTSEYDKDAPVPGCVGNPRSNIDFCVDPQDLSTPGLEPVGSPVATSTGSGNLPLANIGNNGEPANAFPLGKCQGDCDNNGECESGLECFKRGGNGYPAGTPVPGCYGNVDPEADFCYDPADVGSDPSPVSSPAPVGSPGLEPVNQPVAQSTSSGDLDEVGNNGDPSDVFPLDKCQGDCDNDGECKSNLMCFKRGIDSNRDGDAPVPGCRGQGRNGIDFCIDPADLNGGPTTPAGTGSAPTSGPSPAPSEEIFGTYRPTIAPTSFPSQGPTAATESPSNSQLQTPIPSGEPTSSPSGAPTISDSESPTKSPSPSYSPSYTPSQSPTSSPSSLPSGVPSTSPTTSPTKSPAPTKVIVYESCFDAKQRGAPTGETQICPRGGSNCPLLVYCDQDFDGGAWLLQYAYHHPAGGTDPTNGNVIPVDPVNGYSHVKLDAVGITNPDQVEAVRFFCTTSNHNRQINFKSTHSVVRQMAVDGDQSLNEAAIWKDFATTTTYQGHNAFLPTNAFEGYTTTDGAFLVFPFFRSGLYHWAIGATEFNRWECDDIAGDSAKFFGSGNGAETHHEVWVKVGPPPPTEAPTQSPAPSSSPTFAVYQNCTEAKLRGAPTGLTHICPSGVSNANSCPILVYCDQDFDGGGWTLQYAYHHLRDGTDPTNGSVLPLDPNGYSHMNLDAIGITSPDEVESVRFFCNTSHHDRTLHFKSTHSVVRQIAVDGDQSLNSRDVWTDATTTSLYGDHSAFLPEATSSGFADSNGGFVLFPFFKSGQNHWGIGVTDNNRWECDDIAGDSAKLFGGGNAEETHHRVWVRLN